LGPQNLWRKEQRRSNRYELPPLHSILIAAWGDGRRVSSLDGRRIQRCANAASQMRRVARDSYGSKADPRLPCPCRRRDL